MRAILSLLAVSALVAAGCGDSGEAAPAELVSSVVRSEPDATAPVADLVTGCNDAGFALWRTQDRATNLVFSPMSIDHALLMARAAADERTGAAIDAALSLPSGDSAHAAWNTLEQTLAAAAANQPDVTLTIADRIWPRSNVTPDQTWVDLLAADHGVTVQPLDFAGDRAGSRDAINDWVAQQTHQLIPELVPEGFIDERTVLVLTDAVYLAARWQRIFGKYGPETADFTRLDGSKISVDFLTELELGDFPHGRTDGLSFATIPYEGEDLEMLLIVPDEGRFAEMRGKLDQAMVDAIDGAGVTGPYKLMMPKWSTTTSIDLLPWLESIGAAPGLYPAISPEAFIDRAVHGADIKVDEQGTVAAAATVIGFQETGPPEPEMTVAADRPFLYLIRDRTTGLVPFAGQVTDPTL